MGYQILNIFNRVNKTIYITNKTIKLEMWEDTVKEKKIWQTVLNEKY